ncbi:MAG: sulfatase-like hydrolase/transferase [Chitinophagaceae bacterium]
MKKYLLLSWDKNKSFLFLLLSLLASCSLLKVFFYFENRQLLENTFGGETIHHSLFRLAGWSVLYDLLTILVINFPLLLLLNLLQPFKRPALLKVVAIIFYLLNAIMLLLNCMDIFYYRFHYQRANADLLYVLDHSFDRLIGLSFITIAGIILAIIAVLFITWKIIGRFLKLFLKGSYSRFILSALCLATVLIIVNRNTAVRVLIPTYPLVSINTKELQVVQNSFHTLCYSVYRYKNSLAPKKYFSLSYCDSLLPIRKSFSAQAEKRQPKNIVVFIMEGVPASFFENSSPYRVALPFFDSLLQKSIYFSNAYSFGYESNKGIVSILTGTPTLSDIPLYHSSFNNLPITPAGRLLKKYGYHSFFCIGDEFDNFGFAKFASWSGFDNYYCKTDIPGYKNLPTHAFGLHDEYVLNFMHKKINEITGPFMAVNFNISTHFPYGIPNSFKEQLPATYNAQMKTMRYYDYSLQKFFRASENEKWFTNTLFIFCSDHWMLPGGKFKDFSNLDGFKIPIIVYDPSNPVKKINNSIVSQFDILGTIAYAASVSDTIITYGNNLLNEESLRSNEYAFNRMNNALYQVADTSYVLGFNTVTDQPAYLYNYKSDPVLKNDLIGNTAYSNKKDQLLLKAKAFIQKTTMQYFNMPFK